ncbi:MAG: restriction endonuclease subunit S [bacterium]
MNTTKNVPELRFKEFNGEWEERRLGELFSFFSTNSFSRDNLNYGIGEVKNIHYGDIHTKFRSLFNITKEYVPFINKEILNGKITEINFCKEGDIVIADASEDYEGIGKAIELVNLNNEKVVAGLHTLMARPINNKLTIGFTGHMLKSNNVRYRIKMIAQGTKVLSISSKRMKEISLNIPALSEQQKIASFLTAVDKKIEIVTKKIEHLENYKKGLMQKLLTGEIRFPGFNDEWEEEKLGNFIKIQGGYAFKNKLFKEKGIPIIRISNLSIDGKYTNINNLVYYDKTKNDNNFLIKENDLLIAMSGATVGKVSVYNKKNIAYLNQRVGLFKLIKFDKLDYNYIVQYIFSIFFNNQLKSSLATSAQPNISSKDIEKLKIKLSSLPEQQKIASFLTAVDKKIELNKNKLENLKTYKKGLLQKMFV